MYEQHFGLKKRPFRANAVGTDVFVGPHIVATMLGLKKALSARDAVVTMSGPVGSGKTTLVNRALESAGEHRKVVCVPRMRLDSGNVLEFILNELGISDMPSGTIQRFALFRRKLKELEDAGARLFIAIEDGVRLGADTLAEIEALTAADAGESEGTGIVLMGDEGLDDLLCDNQLGRLQQRVRQRLVIASLPVAELRGYLRHCFRLAGSDFEQVFEANAAELLHHVGTGIPRITNNLVESAMTAAADLDLAQVPSSLLARVAENEYGLSAAGFDLTVRAEPEPIPVPEPAAELDSASEPVPEPEIAAAPVPVPVPVLEAELEPVAEFEVPLKQLQDAVADDDIPEFIQDTLPDLKILAPNLAAELGYETDTVAVDDAEPEPLPELVIESQPDPVPEPEAAIACVDSSADDVPDWERDPTMAELKPDLAALELAMSFARNDEHDPAPDDSSSDKEPEPEIPELIPEITLDHAISQRLANNLIDEPGEISAPQPEAVSTNTNDSDTPSIDGPRKPAKKADAEIEKIAAELAKAKSIEDVDDKMAETLFGDELNLIASQVIADAVAAASANDDMDLAAVEDHDIEVPATSVEAPEAGAEVTLGGIEVTLGGNVAAEAPPRLDGSGTDLLASQRLKTVRALNANQHASDREPEDCFDEQPAPANAPDSIEDQITSMTETLKTLQLTAPGLVDVESESKSGFFSRFKRS